MAAEISCQGPEFRGFLPTPKPGHAWQCTGALWLDRSVGSGGAPESAVNWGRARDGGGQSTGLQRLCMGCCAYTSYRNAEPCAVAHF